MQLYNSKSAILCSCEHTGEDEKHQIQCAVMAAGEEGKGVGGQASVVSLIDIDTCTHTHMHTHVHLCLYTFIYV